MNVLQRQPSRFNHRTPRPKGYSTLDSSTLVGETALEVANNHTWKRALGARLAAQINASMWCWMDLFVENGVVCQIPGTVISEGLTPKSLQKITRLFEEAESNGVFAVEKPLVDGNHLTHLVGPHHSVSTRYGVGSFIASRQRQFGKATSIGVWLRERHREGLSRGETLLVHKTLAQMSWAMRPIEFRSTQPSSGDLSPRLREVLTLLLEGRTRKDISSCLEISENTVAGYSKELYRKFNVQSHAELLVKFR